MRPLNLILATIYFYLAFMAVRISYVFMVLHVFLCMFIQGASMYWGTYYLCPFGLCMSMYLSIYHN